MFKLSLRHLPLPAAACALALTAQAAPPSVTFDTTPRAGQHQRQWMDLQSTMKMRVEPGPDATDAQKARIEQMGQQMAQAGPVRLAMQTQHTLQVGAADADGRLPLTFTATSRKGQIDMGGQVMPMPPEATAPMTVKARFDPRDFAFEVQAIEGGSDALQGLMKAQGQTLIGETLQLAKALSQRALTVGDSVDVPLNLNLPMPVPQASSGLKGVVTYTLARLDKGVAHFDLRMKLDVTMDAPLPPPPPAQTGSAASAPATEAPGAAASAPAAEPAPPAAPRMLHLVMTGTGSGHSSLRLSDRLPLASQLDMGIQVTASGPDNTVMRMAMDMRVNSRGERVDKAAAPAPARP